MKQFLRQRVGLPISEADDDPADALPVELDALQRWAVGDRLLRDRLAGLDLARCRAAEWRRGELPPGELGNSLLAEVLDDVEELVAASARFVAGVPTSQEVDVSVGHPDLPDGARVVGTVSGVHGDTAVRVEFSKLAAKQRVRAWVRLVALTAALPDRRWRAVTVGRGARRRGRGRHGRARGRRPRPRRARRPGRPAPRRAARAAAAADDRRAGLRPHPHRRRHARTTRWPRRCAAGARAGSPSATTRSTPACSAPRRGREVLTTAGTGGEPTRFGDLALRLWRPLLDAEVLDDRRAEPLGTDRTRSPSTSAATLPTGTTVLEASAGTGKTFTIAALAARYVAEGHARLPELLLVTFGRDATQELRERVRERLVSAERGAARPRRGAGGHRLGAGAARRRPGRRGRACAAGG